MLCIYSIYTELIKFSQHFLRVCQCKGSVLPTITYQQQTINVPASDNVLETLEQAGFKIPFSCRAGVCQSCIMRADGDIPPAAQQGLSQSQKAQSFFLACCCYPTSALALSSIGERLQLPARVVDKWPLNDTVMGLRLAVDTTWFPGQHITLWYDEQQGRSYSIASRCIEDSTLFEKVIELHIKRHEQGVVSQWLHTQVATGDELLISKPAGHCFYNSNHHGSPLLMAATGTGLAPLYGILQEALACGHTQPIYCYTAAAEAEGLYYQQALQALAQQYSHFHAIAVVKHLPEQAVDNGAGSHYLHGDLVDIVLQQHPELKGWKVFLCGSPAMIKQLRKQCFFHGASIPDILTDAFELNAPA